MPDQATAMKGKKTARKKFAAEDPCADLDHCRKCSEKILAWTVLANFFLIVLSFTGGFLSGSVGLMADGTHSICNLITSGLVAYGAKLSQRKSDDNFPFGYGKLELVVSLAVYSVLFGLGVFISVSSLVNAFTHPGHSPSLIALPIALVAILITYMLYRYNYCAGKKLNSWGISAGAQNCKADLLTTVAVCVGIIFSQFGPSFAIFDSMAAMLVGLIIAKDAVQLWRADFKLVLDQFPDSGFTERILSEVSKVFPGSVKLLKPKRLGRKFWIGLSLQMPDNASIEDWEAAQKTIENRLRSKVDSIGEVDFFLGDL